MAEMITTKATGLKYKEVGATGTQKPIMGVLQGLQVTQDAPTLTPVDAEFYDAPFLQIPNNGAFKLIFDLVKFDWKDLPDLIGGEFEEVTKNYTPAQIAPIIFKEFQLDFGVGIKSLIIFNGQISANWDMTDLKTTPVKLHIEILATPDEDGDYYTFATE